MSTSTPRRSGDAERTPTSARRDTLRAVHERQQAALTSYLALDAKAARLRRQLTELEAHQQRSLGEFAAGVGPDLASQLTGVTVTRARDAATGWRQQRHGPGGEAAVPVLGEVAP